jgi:NAD(P)-dependent dehydrogenase (short-subunit alcohol dehydrogenase family)
MTTRFDGRVALVTGGGTGIGRATAEAFARERATVIVAGLDEEPLRDTVKAIESAGGEASWVACDVREPGDAERMVETAVRRHGPLDIAFNNAGLMVAGRLADLEPGQWSTAMSVATGTWLSMKHEIRSMLGHGGGVIVNMSSIIGPHRGIPGTGAYGAAKAAITAITRTAAVEYIGAGIRINAVSPGPVATPFSLIRGETEQEQAQRMKTTLPLGRVGGLSEVTGTVLWLASPDSGFAVGTDVVIDGGATA